MLIDVSAKVAAGKDDQVVVQLVTRIFAMFSSRCYKGNLEDVISKIFLTYYNSKTILLLFKVLI